MHARFFFFLTLAVLTATLVTISSSASTFDWHLDRVGDNHQIEGYVPEASYVPGKSIDFHVSCQKGFFKTEIFRMGWYAGEGAKLVASVGVLSCQKQAIPAPSTQTGLVAPNWPVTFKVPSSSSWAAGIYLAKLTENDGYQNYIPFTIRSSKPTSNYLFIHSINTDEAYNLWGGNSLYKGYTPALNIHRAVEASLNRPFLMPNGGNDGSGNFLSWEYPMIRFLEENNYQVDYATDIDIHQHPSLLLKYKTIIITGHDEYWSTNMLDGYKDAVGHGVNLAIFAANTAYRPVRFEPDPITGEPDRIMVNYKSAAIDPFTKTNPRYSTPSSWMSSPLNEPESALLGSSFGGETKSGIISTTSAGLVGYGGPGWIFKGTGLKKGDEIPGLIGYEYDEFKNSSPHPSHVDIVFHSPLININGKADFADSTYYKLPSGGQVFNAGTMEWSWGLDPAKSEYNLHLVQVTQNILNRFGDS